MIFSGGAKGVFLAFCMSIMCARDCEELHPRGGVILAPSGYYQSLRLIPAIAGGTIHVEQDLSGAIVAGWLADTAHLTGRAIYVPLVNNMDGRVLSRDQAHSIAAAVVDHNQAHRTNPVYVLGDDVYAGSYLADGAEPTPIGAVPGISPWCVSVATPSKTFALPTGRIAFATTTNATLRQALGHYRTVLSHGRVSQISELTSAAALCLTPQQWISAWNRRYRAALRLFGTEIGRLNAELGQQVFAIEPPQGGWYMCLRIHRSLFGDQARSSLDAQAALLYYGEDDRDSGLAMLPGELFGQDCRDGWFKLRANVAVDAETITRTVTRLRDMAHAIRKDRSRVLAYALGRARRVVPHLDATLAQRRY
jgi:aspartate/methionine/tyrosine aminotransferase